MKSFKIALTAFVITAGVIKAAPALAGPVAENVSFVRTADLDLTTAAGRAALDHRLVNAAIEVCGTASSADLLGSNQVLACRTDVLAKARSEQSQLAGRRMPIAVVAGR